MSLATRTSFGYYVNASSGTGSVTVYSGASKGAAINALPVVMAVSMAGSATTDYANITDDAGNIILQVRALSSSSYVITGVARFDGVTCQMFGGTNGTVAIFVG